MSRGNINYKYLRRRKSWFRRNWKTLLVWAILIIVVAGGITLGAMKIFNFGLFKKSGAENQKGPEAHTEQETQQETREVIWIEDQAPENRTVEYTAPENVEYPYFIKVNRAANCVTVYGVDESGEYRIPVTAFACSCGREGEETIQGENFTTTDKYLWRLMVDDTYGQYAFRINGGYLFHSVPYMDTKNDTLEPGEYNKLGSFASLGCVRMCVRDVKWLYDNCPSGTKVTIYDDVDNPGPLGKPESIKIPEDSEYAGWDPTDPNEDNPWRQYSARINGAKDITVHMGEKTDLLAGVTAVDTCGNDISEKIATVGRYTFDQEGEYNLTYQVTDAIGSTDKVTVKLKVIK